MSVVNSTRDEVAGGCYVYTWVLAAGDTGEPVFVPGGADKTVQMIGTFLGSTATLEGSCKKTPSVDADYFTLTDPQGNNLAKTAAGGDAVTENVNSIRPNISGGAATAITVILFVRSTR